MPWGLKFSQGSIRETPEEVRFRVRLDLLWKGWKGWGEGQRLRNVFQVKDLEPVRVGKFEGLKGQCVQEADDLPKITEQTGSTGKTEEFLSQC